MNRDTLLTNPGLALAGILAFCLLLAACVPAEIEPALGGPVPVSRTALPSVTPISELARGTTTPFPSPTLSELSLTLTTTPWDPSRPAPTRTPVPPFPGMIYRSPEGLWQVSEGWQPALLTDLAAGVLSPDGRQVLLPEGDDIWLVELESGFRRNLTEGSGRVHCCLQWWPGRPDTIVFGSWPAESDLGPSTGYLTSVRTDGSDYKVLEPDTPSNALPAPGPGDTTIAYDRAGTSWLYHWGGDHEPLDPVAYGLSNVVRIGGPAWSPDGRHLAWTVAITDPNWRIALAVFDLGEQTGVLLHPYENAGRGGWFPPPAWSPDGRYLAFAAEDINADARGIWAVAVDGSEEQYLGDGRNPLWSPDGRWLIYETSRQAETDEEPLARLIEVASWYESPMYLPPRGSLVSWPGPVPGTGN